MKNLFGVLAVLIFATSAQAGGLFISEIVDATLPGGLPKFVELTNGSAAPIDLSGFSVANQNNADTELGNNAIVLPAVNLAPGDSYVLSFESGDAPGTGLFFDTFGFDADNLDFGSFINGDDRVVLFSGAALAGDPTDGTVAAVVDIYGVDGVDGSGEVWEYTDGYSFRNPGVTSGNGGVFDPSEWTFGGVNSLETGDDTEETALILANTTPGTHGIIPEPASVMLLAFGACAMFASRKRS